jgi:hypothetical protein
MRLLITTAICSAFALALALALAACSKSSGEEAFDNLQDCYDDHVATTAEGLTPKEAIVACCIEHPIAGHTVVCKDTVGDCITFVSAELNAGTTDADISAGCMDYVRQKDL